MTSHDDSARAAARIRIALLLLGSGACALVYQIAWTREFRLIFGASTAASAAVLAIFAGGLGAGGLYFGRRVDRVRSPLAFYASLEIGIALSAAATPFLMELVRASNVWAGGSMRLGLGGASVLRLVLSALVLALPTFLMGGTLPAAVRAIEAADDPHRRRLALLYGCNTMGAVCGTLLSTFVMLEHFGTRRTLWIACLVNLLIAIAARSLSRRIPDAETVHAPEEAPAAPAPLVLGAAAVTGFAFFLMELVWYRMLGPLLGGTVFTFGLILAVALAGIGLGGLFYATVMSGRRSTPALLGTTCLLEALLLALPFAMGDRLAVLTLILRPLGSSMGFQGHVLVWTVISAIVVFPAAFISGIQFPLLVSLLGRGSKEVGRQIGLAYAWNTGGAIVGSLAGGFLLLPLLSAPGCWRAVATLLALLGAGFVVIGLRRGSGFSRVSLVPAALAVVLVAMMLLADGPTAAWRHSQIGVGRVSAGVTSSPNALRSFARQQRAGIKWEVDGLESSVALDESDGVSFIINGKVDGHATGDASTQVMGGLLGALLLPRDVRRSLIIGLGTGETAGWLADTEAMERVDVVELEPAVLDVARECSAANRNVLEHPKVSVLLGDAREVLLTSRQRYDIVFSEPSNPYRAGIASLYTLEYYEAVRDRLEEGGIFLQWLQAYEVDAETIRTVYATVGAAFPYVETWNSKGNDLVLVASREPPVHDLELIRKRMQTEPFRTALAVTWRTDDAEGVFSHYVAAPTFAAAIAEAERGLVNTDDRNHVEFGFARGVQSTTFGVEEVRRLATKLGMHRPPVRNGTLDESRVLDSALAVPRYDPPRGVPAGTSASPEQLARAWAQRHYVEGRTAEALASWRSQTAAPRGPNEISMLADLLAEAGDEEARRYAASIAALHPAEAAHALARLALAKGDVPAARTSLLAAFTHMRADPWTWPPATSRSLALAQTLAKKDPAAAGELFDALLVSFSVMEMEGARRGAVFEIAKLLPDRCAEALKPFEPEAPWDGDFLLFRAACYGRSHHPAAALAKQELLEFLEREPQSFDTGIR